MMELIEGHMHAYLFLKLEDYEHEQEFRFCLYSALFNAKDGIRIKYGKALVGVILGCRFPEHT